MSTPNLQKSLTAVRERTRHRETASPQSDGSQVQTNIPQVLAGEVVWLGVETLKVYARNARQHSPKQVTLLAAAIRQFGFTNPILIDAEGQILAGHGRLEAAKSLGMTKVPTLRIERMTEAQKRAYVIGDNRLAELAKWDREMLRLEMIDLSLPDLNFSAEVTGFSTAEIDLIIEQDAPKAPSRDDQLPALQPHAVSRVGDLWQLGSHLLYCGNSLETASYDAVMAGAHTRTVITDPPYNVPIAGHVGGLGRVQHREFVMASGEMTEGQFTEFLESFLRCSADVCDLGALIYAFMDWRHAYELMTAGRRIALQQIALCCWNKDNAGMGSFYRSKHELCFVFRHGDAPHVNNVELGRYGRYRTNVWDYPGANTFRKGRDADLAAHPTVKPVAMISDIIRDCTKRGETVLDPFCGSGTILIAAERTGRHARAIELDPLYVDAAIRRWQTLTGIEARLAGENATFAEIAAERSTEAAHG
ncbi:MAG: site-specific DNA-methyltransferase [Alphaproteobacteria bacterium]